MAQACGTKDKTQSQPARARSFWPGLVRAVGFCALTGAAGAILAGVVLLPAAAELAWTKYQRDCDAVCLAEAQATVDALGRLQQEIASDEVLARRLAWSHLGLVPRNEVSVTGTASSAEPLPGTIPSVDSPDPPKPGGWVIASARRVTRPATRRGLLVLAGSLVLSAMLMFGPGVWPSRPRL